MERLVGGQALCSSMEALSADGEHFVRIALPDYARKWLVLLFYLMGFTSVCPTELTVFSEHREVLHTAGVELLSVNTDSIYTHQAWQRNGLGGLGCLMAADQTLRVCVDYGVPLGEEGVALRGLFLIDPEQKIRYNVIHDNNIGRDPEGVLQVLTTLKTGGLCAAGWKAGKKNLRPNMAGRKAPVPTGMASMHIYTIPGCSYCHSAKESLRQGRVSYEEISLAEDRAGQTLMENRGYMGLPVTMTGAGEIMGYNMPRIKATLDLSGANKVK